jgi:hypothetical protein
MIYKTLRRKLMITQREPQLKPRMNVSDPEGYGAPALTSGTFHVTVKRYEHEVGHKNT